MKINKELMKEARDKRDKLKQALKESLCKRHKFLPCSKPNIIAKHYPADTEYHHLGDIHYHQCYKCSKKVGFNEN